MAPPHHGLRSTIVWKFGEGTGLKFTRPAQTIGTAKHSVKFSEIRQLKLYNAPINVSEQCLPPANVILSSELAYRVLRCALATSCFSMRQLHQYWPANFTSKGAPCEYIPPMGRPAIVEMEDGTCAFATYNGYTFCGAFGFNQLVAQAGGSETNAVTLRGWFEPEDRHAGLGSTTRFEPEQFARRDPSNHGTPDPERMSQSDRWHPALKRVLKDYNDGRLPFRPGIPSPTHPDLQPYGDSVFSNLRQAKRIGTNVSWARTMVDPLDPITMAEIPDVLERSAVKAKTQPHKLDPRTLAALAEILGTIVLGPGCLKGHVVIVVGTLDIFQRHVELGTWLQEHGAIVELQLSARTTTVLKGKVEPDNKLIKDILAQRRKGQIIEIFSERDFFDTLKELNAPDADQESAPDTPTPGPSRLPPVGPSTPTPLPKAVHKGKTNATQVAIAATPSTPRPSLPEKGYALGRIALQFTTHATHGAELVTFNTYQKLHGKREKTNEALVALSETIDGVSDTNTQQLLRRALANLDTRLQSESRTLQEQAEKHSNNHDIAISNLFRSLQELIGDDLPEEIRSYAMRTGANRVETHGELKPLQFPGGWYTHPNEDQMAAFRADVAGGTTTNLEYHVPPKPPTPKKRFAAEELTSP
ncbi:brct domain-containing protein [Diplodia corticola]|uniref:Brct domain-containing protein n=1 Tax=Diplodia corticola TaxID=236234 RepID=A0A1J9RA47_9PEZI|nr:brct domain-containing protein [Diplodia corticola]OJD37416.1 brct domain-containing protein [Diplodia corticola]